MNFVRLVSGAGFACRTWQCSSWVFVSVLLLTVFSGSAFAAAANATNTSKKAAIDIDDPEACAACHGNIVKEWQQSMHSRSHSDRDPIFRHMRDTRIAKQGVHVAKECALCHTPRSPQDSSAPTAKAGVSCASCHNLRAVHVGQGLLGANALEFRGDDQLASGQNLPPGVSSAHSTGMGSPALADGQSVCMACHDVMANSSGAPTCTTGLEFADREKSDATCVNCHMPLVDGPVDASGRQQQHVSHVFSGPHRAWYESDSSVLQQAVELHGRWASEVFYLTLKNTSGHGFPSGFPGRLAILSVVAYDKSGLIAWRNFDTNPMAEAPQSVFNMVYVNGAGKPVPAPFATALKRDNRLQTDEVRTLAYTLPTEAVAVEVTLVYRLLSPKLADFINLPKNAVERESRLLAKQYWRRVEAVN